MTAHALPEAVLFSVADRGPGDPGGQAASTIFERFGQVDASDSREKGGTGLGLPIARSIVEQHGGPDLGGQRARARARRSRSPCRARARPCSPAARRRHGGAGGRGRRRPGERPAGDAAAPRCRGGRDVQRRGGDRPHRRGTAPAPRPRHRADRGRGRHGGGLPARAPGDPADPRRGLHRARPFRARPRAADPRQDPVLHEGACDARGVRASGSRTCWRRVGAVRPATRRRGSCVLDVSGRGLDGRQRGSERLQLSRSSAGRWSRCASRPCRRCGSRSPSCRPCCGRGGCRRAARSR